MKTIVCLVSRQAMANVIPVLEFKPDKVILLITEEEKSVAKNLKELFVKHKIQVEIFREKLDAYDIEKVKNICMDVIRENDNELILNLTGGTKTMAVAAYEIFRSVDKQIVYHNPASHKIIFLNPISKNDIDVESKINVEDYLLAHGYKIISEQTKSGRAEKYNTLFKKFDKNRFSHFVDFYNIVKQEIPLGSPRASKEYNKFQFSKNYDKIIIWDKVNNTKIDFELSGFNYGDCLESILYLILKDKIKPDDIRYSVKVKKENIESEIDVLLTKDCCLHLYSCKDTKKMNKQYLYEIEVLRNVTGGTFGRAYMVVTKGNDYIKSFGKQIHIDTVNIKELF
ncbi:MAG: DUF1887 family CARF protein [Ignavibacteria bacterium]|nr:DUF1887 family CARF protein [Ignavibacteria bacterium]